MSVKTSQSALRMLKVLERLARMQPVGLTALARSLDCDKSALQRDLATLAEAGWIQPAGNDVRAWELSHQLLVLARQPHSSRMLVEQLRPVLERLYALTEETVYLTVPHLDRFVVIHAIESRHAPGFVPPVGIVIPARGSATGKAFMALLDPEPKADLLGDPPDSELADALQEVRQRGYAVSDGELVPGSTSFAAAFTDPSGKPAGTFVLTTSGNRIDRAQWPAIGHHLADAAAFASRTLMANGF